jgi:Transposase
LQQSGEVSRLKQPERRELWRQRVAQQKNSGQTVRAFCGEHKLSEHSFYWWRRQLGCSTEPPIRFALVETVTPPPKRHPPRQGQTQIELVLTSGERLQIPAEAATVRLVLSVLREAGPADR